MSPLTKTLRSGVPVPFFSVFSVRRNETAPLVVTRFRLVVAPSFAGFTLRCSASR